MLPISIIFVGAEVGQARLRVKPGDDSIVGECGGWPRRQLSAPSSATKVRVLSLRSRKNDLDPESDFDEHP
jgi:hypothetical protein